MVLPMVFQTINRTFQFRLITRLYLFFIIVCIFFCGEKDSKKISSHLWRCSILFVQFPMRLIKLDRMPLWRDSSARSKFSWPREAETWSRTKPVIYTKTASIVLSPMFLRSYLFFIIVFGCSSRNRNQWVMQRSLELFRLGSSTSIARSAAENIRQST